MLLIFIVNNNTFIIINFLSICYFFYSIFKLLFTKIILFISFSVICTFTSITWYTGTFWLSHTLQIYFLHRLFWHFYNFLLIILFHRTNYNFFFYFFFCPFKLRFCDRFNFVFLMIVIRVNKASYCFYCLYRFSKIDFLIN